MSVLLLLIVGFLALFVLYPMFMNDCDRGRSSLINGNRARIIGEVQHPVWTCHPCTLFLPLCVLGVGFMEDGQPGAAGVDCNH